FAMHPAHFVASFTAMFSPVLVPVLAAHVTALGNALIPRLHPGVEFFPRNAAILVCVQAGKQIGVSLFLPLCTILAVTARPLDDAVLVGAHLFKAYLCAFRSCCGVLILGE